MNCIPAREPRQSRRVVHHQGGFSALKDIGNRPRVTQNLFFAPHLVAILHQRYPAVAQLFDKPAQRNTPARQRLRVHNGIEARQPQGARW